MSYVQVDWNKLSFLKELCFLPFICVSVWVQCQWTPEGGIRSPTATVICGGGLSYMGNWELNSRPWSARASNHVFNHWPIFPAQELTFLFELTHLGQVTNLSVNGEKTQWPTSLKIQTVSFCFPNNKHWLPRWKVTCHLLLVDLLANCILSLTPQYSRKKETLCLWRIIREAAAVLQGVRSRDGSTEKQRAKKHPEKEGKDGDFIITQDHYQKPLFL